MSEAEAIHGSDKEAFQNQHERQQAWISETRNFCEHFSQECNKATDSLSKAINDHFGQIVLTECAIVGVALVTHRMFPQVLPAIKQVLGIGVQHGGFMAPATDSVISAGIEINPLTRSAALAKNATDVLVNSGIEINPMTRSTLDSALGRESLTTTGADWAKQGVRCTQPAIDTLLNSGIEINPQTRSMALASLAPRAFRWTLPETDAILNSGIKITPQTRAMTSAELLNLHRP